MRPREIERRPFLRSVCKKANGRNEKDKKKKEKINLEETNNYGKKILLSLHRRQREDA